jgi:peptidoglycan biosynthesis protein MviN/MurJ (putative lipid II flippase)
MIKDLTRHPLFNKIFGLTILLYLSPAFGLLLDIIFIRVIGAGEVMDVFRILMAFMILGNTVIAQQLFKYVVIPKLSQYCAEGKDSECITFTHHFMAFIMLLLIPVLFYGVIYPQHILAFLAPGLSTEAFVQAIPLMQIIIVGFVCTTLAGAVSALLNFYGNFWAQPLGQILINVAVVIGLILFGYNAAFFEDAYQMIGLSLMVGIGVMTALTLFLYAQIANVKGKSFKLQPLTFALIILPLIIPQMLMLASELMKPIVINRTLSTMEAGSAAIYMLGFKLLMLAAIPTRSFLTVFFPSMSNQTTAETKEFIMKSFLVMSLRLFIVSIAIAVMCYIFADVIIGIISYLSNLEIKKADNLLAIFKIFLIFIPFAALGNYFIQQAYAVHKRWLVMAYSLINITAFAIILPTFNGQTIEMVTWAFVIIQSVSFMTLGVSFLITMHVSKN